MTSVVGCRAYLSSVRFTFVTLADRRQEYFPRLRRVAAAGTDAVLVDSPANYRRNEMRFERVGPSCYPYARFSALLEQSASASQAPDEMPTEDMHRAVSKISQVHGEICETAVRIVAGSSRELGHGEEADGIGAGG